LNLEKVKNLYRTATTQKFMPAPARGAIVRSSLRDRRRTRRDAGATRGAGRSAHLKSALK
jgi:hypothetical protein